MCLLVTQSKDVVFDDAFLHGVYMRNGDGIGVMYSEDNKLVIKRALPKTEKEFVDFYRKEIEGRDCAWHARMRTHGDIDFDNCHPYQVLSSEEGYPLYMAHNGVLHTGNAGDTSKSDTWHYIQNYLRPMLLNNPGFFLTPAFKDLISEHIGSGNKFVFMDAYGNTVTINNRQGVEYNGAWLSNTYAWDTTGTKHQSYSYKASRAYSSPYAFYSLNDDDDDAYEAFFGKKEKDVKPSVEEVEFTDVSEEDCVNWICSLYEEMEKVSFDADLISWQNAEEYYEFMGSEACWEMIELIAYGSYTEEELVSEICFLDYEKPTSSVDETVPH